MGRKKTNARKSYCCSFMLKTAVSKGRFQKSIRAPTSATWYEVGNGEIRLKVEFCDQQNDKKNGDSNCWGPHETKVEMGKRSDRL